MGAEFGFKPEDYDKLGVDHTSNIEKDEDFDDEDTVDEDDEVIAEEVDHRPIKASELEEDQAA